MAVPGLYIPIRGDYSDFQKDLARLRGIAREEGTRISEALQMAISPKDAVVGLTKIGAELKKLTAAAQSTGRTLNAPVEQLTEFAQKANVAASVVEELHYEMLKTARDRQLESALRSLQKQCGLTEDAVARLQAHMGDTAGSIDTAMKALGVRSAQAIKKEMASLEASFDHAIKHGNLTIKEQERLVDALEKKWAALNAEMGVMPVKHPFFAAKETLGVRETGDVMAEARQARQAYETIQQSAWKTREMSVASHDAMIASLKKLAQELRLTASETSKFIAAFAGSRDALDSAMGSAGLRSTRAIRQEIAEVNRLLQRVESSASATLEDKERMRAWAVNRTDALTREMRMPGQLTANERYEQATGLLGMKTDAQYRQQAKGIVQAYLEVKTSARSSAEDVQRAHARMIESFRRLREEMNSWRPQAPDISAAFSTLNVRSTATIKAEIEALRAAFARVRADASSTGEDVRRAFASMSQGVRTLQAELNGPTYRDKLHGFYHLLGIRSPQEIEDDKRNIIRAYQEVINSISSAEGKMAAFAARTDALQRLSREAGTWQEPARAQVDPLRQKYNTLSAQVGGAGVSFGQYEARNKASEAVKAFQELHGRLPKYAKEFRDLAAAAGVSAREIWKIRDALDHSSSAFKALIGYGQVWLTFGFAHTALGFVKTAMALENVKVAFTAIYGTADMADKKLEYVRQISDQLGLSFLDTAEGAKKLFAAANGTPVERDANKVFRAFSNMSAAMKLTGDETKGVFLAISQMISKGKVSAEELRQQLAERMPGAVNLFAKSIGKSTQELDKMLQKGEVTLEHFLKFADAVDMTYSAGAEAAGHSLQAELNRVKNTWIEFQERMTDTGQLASLVGGFNSVLKETLGIFEKVAPYIDDIATAGLAAWMGSSIAAGGKLNAVLGVMTGGFKKISHNLKIFAAVSAASATPVGNLTKALGGLKIAMIGIGKHPALIAFFTAMAGLLALNAYQAKRASRAYADVQKGMEEKLAEEAKRKASDEASNFNPDKIRESMISDSKKALAEFNENAITAQRDVDRYLERSQANYRAMVMSAQDEVDENLLNNQKKVVAEARYNIENWASELDAALKNKSAEQAGDVLKRIKEESGALLNNIKTADVDDSAFQIINRQISDLEAKASKLFINLTKWGDTFSAESTSAAKRLGVDLAELDKQFNKVRDAASKTDFGKAINSLKDMDKVRDIMNDATMAYDANAAAMAGQLQQMDGFVVQLGNMGKKYDEHNEKLMEMMQGFNGSDEALEKIRLKEEELVGEHNLLDTETEKVADTIARLAATAGGSDAQMNIMIQALQAARDQGKITVEIYEALIGKVYELFGAAQTLSMAAAGAAHINAMDAQLAGAEANAIFKKGGKHARSSYIVKRAQQDIAAGKTPKGEEAYGYEYDTKKKIQAINESLKSGKGGKGGGGGKRVDNTQEKWHSAEEGWRKKIADMQGQKDVQTLAKDFADMDKQLKGSSVDMKALKKDYLEAFSTKYATDLNKEILQLRGNEAELARIDIEEKYKAKAAAIEGMAEEAKKLGITVADQTPKLAEYRKLLEGQAREQQLEKELPYYEKFSWFDGMKSEALAKQNELIAIQAEKMKGTIPDELIERWKELEELQNRVKNGNDVIAGVALGAKKYALEMGNMAENVSDLVQKSFDDMADAFTDLVMTGKASFTDLANSIIRDLMRIAIKQAIIGPIANGIGSLFGGLFTGMSNIASGGTWNFGVASGGFKPTFNKTGMTFAHGGVLSGLHGYSNQIVDRPTLFSYGSQLTKFAKGGVMGEAGPEAVMPLTRTASGHLGVRSDGSNAPIVNVVINNATGQQASQQTKTDNQGNKSIEVMIGDMAAQQMMKTGTALNKAARSFSGVEQQVVRR